MEFTYGEAETKYKGSQLIFIEKHFTNRKGENGLWEYVVRPDERPVNGACTIPIIPSKNSKEPSTLILISEFRIPVMKYVLSFPKGRVDDISEIKEEALRELLEETGYKGNFNELFKEESLLTYVDAYKSTEIEKYFIVQCTENKNPQDLEAGEAIKVHLVPINEKIDEFIHDLAKENNYGIDKGLLSFLQGIKLGISDISY